MSTTLLLKPSQKAIDASARANNFPRKQWICSNERKPTEKALKAGKGVEAAEAYGLIHIYPHKTKFSGVVMKWETVTEIASGPIEEMLDWFEAKVKECT